MDLRKLLTEMFTSYFTLVTLITVATLVLGLCFEPEAAFGYEAFASPLLYGACGVVPVIVMYSKRELTIKEFIVRKIIQFIIIEVLILFVAFYQTGLAGGGKVKMILLGISVLVVYILSHVVEWIQNYLSAKQMTAQLIKLQESVK